MLFLEGGTEIPKDLIDSVYDGNAIFLCGAGVSYTAELPLFEELTETVFKKLGETWEDDIFEKKAFNDAEFDRVLGSLERRVCSDRNPNLVRDQVSCILSIHSSTKLTNHSNLLKISKNKNGDIRLLTTNFDTLFELAANDCGIDIPSFAVKEIPKAGGHKDIGIMHIHGRIKNDELKLNESDLILTSSDFGDAYLRDGWISRYIEDRMRIGTLVLVGYQAEDAAMRLLLETIDADRKRFRDLAYIYALDAVDNNGNAEFKEAIWRAKGVFPIIFNDYKLLYDSLAEWVNYNTDPAAYAKARVYSILQ